MPDPLDRLLDPQRLQQYWGQKETAGPIGLSDRPSALDLFQSFQTVVRAELGNKSLCVDLLLAEAQQLLSRQADESFSQADSEKNREQLKKVLEQIEDMLDTLLWVTPQ
jgi:hypothetical protein